MKKGIKEGGTIATALAAGTAIAGIPGAIIGAVLGIAGAAIIRKTTK